MKKIIAGILLLLLLIIPASSMAEPIEVGGNCCGSIVFEDFPLEEDEDLEEDEEDIPECTCMDTPIEVGGN